MEALSKLLLLGGPLPTAVKSIAETGGAGGLWELRGEVEETKCEASPPVDGSVAPPAGGIRLEVVPRGAIAGLNDEMEEGALGSEGKCPTGILPFGC